MARKKHSAKQIVALLRQIEVEFGWLHGSWPQTGFPKICFLQFVAPVEPRESVGSAARISYC
jgi:hypothetical protein